jgi:hypothetical protein
MKDSLLRYITAAAPAKAGRIKIAAPKIRAVNLDPSQPATTARAWWAPDALVAPAKPVKAKPAATKMNATVLAELARIASRSK